MSRFSFEQDENGPFFWMTMHSEDGEERARFDWETATLYTHRFIDRHFDHVFIQTDEVDQQTDLGRVRALGAFIWRQTLEDFDDLVNAMITHDFPHIHMPHPNEMDAHNYDTTGLVPPTREAIETTAVEVDDGEQLAREEMSKWDEEWAYWDKELNDGN